MKHKEIIGLMTGETPYTKKTLSGLSDLIKKYPYFQTAQLLHTLNLLNLQDSYFLIDLRKTSVYMPDRKQLFFLINDKFFMQEQFGAFEKETGKSFVDEIEIPHFEEDEFPSDDIVIEDLTANPVIEEEELLPVIEEEFPSDDIVIEDLAANPVIEEEELLPVIEEEEPVVAKEMETPIISSDYVSMFLSDVEGNEDVPPLQYQETIDKFLEKDNISPLRIKLNKTDKEYKVNKEPEEIIDSLQETKAEDNFFSETLAKIYIKQKNYGKALEIIRKLNLIYPEKSRYFADQIRFLEKLIINTNKK